MTASRLGVRLAGAGAAVAIVVALDSTGLASPQVSIVVDDCAQLAAGVLAAVCCGRAMSRSVGVERTWRRLMAIGMAGWSLGQLVWSWYQIFAETPLPSPSLADVGYLTLPVFALAALLAIAADGKGESRWRGVPGQPVGRTRLVLVLDGLVVVGSLLILTWYTALGAVVTAGAPTRLAFAVAIAYPVTDVMLVVLVVLLLATRPVASRLRPQLALLGLGLVGLAVSDSIFAYLVASGAARMPPIANIGFVAGPVLIALAAVTTGASDCERRHAAAAGQLRGWAHLLLPYVPLAGICVQVVIQQAAGQPFDAVEVYLGTAVLAMVMARQMITLIDNTVLLGRVSEAQQRLRYEACHDPLTGLANRALFHRRLEAALELSRGAHRPAALLFIDLDDFKLINDRLGHSAGDRVLQAVAARLRSCVRETDTVARLGGDEFGILIDGHQDNPEAIGRQVLAALRAPFAMNGHTLTVGASIGAAESDRTEPDMNADRLLRLADAAMYAAKRGGKGVLLVHGDDASIGDDRTDLLTLLAEALASPGPGSGLDVYYQPIVRMSDGACVAVEALARWNHPVIGPIPTVDFIAVAERAGLVGGIDNFVLDRACHDLAGQPAGRGLALHVNVSASRLGNPDLETTVDRTLRRYGLEPCRLVLEITETHSITDPDAAAASAHRLEKIGVRLALDDFGAGHHTLAHLHQLPIHILKLDRSLTRLSPAGPSALCRSMLAIAADLGITVIAEAIEQPEQATALARMGCGYAQGYLYGHPAPVPEVLAPGIQTTIPAC